MITLGKTHRLVADAHNVILQEKYFAKAKKEDGKKREALWKSKAYYPNWKKALEGLLEKEIAGLSDVFEICGKIDEVKETIRNLEVENGSQTNQLPSP